LYKRINVFSLKVIHKIRGVSIMDFDDFEFDMDLPEVKIHKLPEGLKDEYKIFVSFDSNKKAIIKYEWSPMIGHSELEKE